MKEDQVRKENDSSEDSDCSEEDLSKCKAKAQGHPNCVYCWSKKTLTDM